MKIIVDADACPVKKIIVEKAAEYGVETVMVCDTSHVPVGSDGKFVIVDKGADSADIKLINLTEKGDIVVTGDYGVAALAVAKGAYCIGNSGEEYTDANLDKLLFERFLAKKSRRAGLKTKGPAARKAADDLGFEKILEKYLKKS